MLRLTGAAPGMCGALLHQVSARYETNSIAIPRSAFSQTSEAQNFINQSRPGRASEMENFITLDLVRINAGKKEEKTFHICRARPTTPKTLRNRSLHDRTPL
jgi:hypothetical protein